MLFTLFVGIEFLFFQSLRLILSVFRHADKCYLKYYNQQFTHLTNKSSQSEYELERADVHHGFAFDLRSGGVSRRRWLARLSKSRW